MESSLAISEILRESEKKNSNSVAEELTIQETEVEPIEVEVPGMNSVETELRVDFTTTETVEVSEINDVHGRLSDQIECAAKVLGLSVIPLSMCNIAPEVKSLKRYSIFDFNGQRLAMSPNIRKDVVEKYKNRIYQTLSAGTMFIEQLNKLVTYDGKDYMTLDLSQAEWTYILSVYRLYKSRMYIVEGKRLMMEILAERR